jgi:AraC-like DNA-binding protein
VKAITDLPVNEFIKTLRLKKAAALLQQGLQNVNEVAGEVGFNDRSHFSKSFTKHFGISPAQYQKEKSNQ